MWSNRQCRRNTRLTTLAQFYTGTTYRLGYPAVVCLDLEIGIGAGQLDEPFAVPLSCCRKKEDTDCSILVLGSENLGNIFYSKGCADELVSVVGEHLVYGLVAGLGLVLTEVLGLSLSLCLCCTLARIEARKA